MAAKAQSQVLPPKEANLFKNIGVRYLKHSIGSL
jgi:hypothetical protein